MVTQEVDWDCLVLRRPVCWFASFRVLVRRLHVCRRNTVGMLFAFFLVVVPESPCLSVVVCSFGAG